MKKYSYKIYLDGVLIEEDVIEGVNEEDVINYLKDPFGDDIDIRDVKEVKQ